MNVFTAVVRLGSDPEQKYTAGGDSVVTFNAAVDSGYGDKKARPFQQLARKFRTNPFAVCWHSTGIPFFRFS